MAINNNYEVIIVGGGPAGMATALHLQQRDPSLMERVLILERAEHPRLKLCGGAVTFHGVQQLRALGIEVDAQAFSVDNLIFRLGTLEFEVPYRDSMRIYEREAFDAALARVVAERGIQLQDNTRVLDLQQTEHGYRLMTDRGEYCTRVLVAADGAKSTIRQKLGMFSTVGVARLLRVLSQEQTVESPLWERRTAVFDFTPVLRGIQGYMWDFPCYKADVPTMNYGIFDSRFDPVPFDQRPHGHFKGIFEDELTGRNVDVASVTLRGHPVRWFHPDSEFSRPHVLLVGDAAGVDPLFAEGISFALEYGSIAAEAILEARSSHDYRFADYRKRLLRHRLGRLLARRTAVARHLYGHRFPFLWRWLWRAAAVSPKRVQQQIGNSLALLPPV